MTKKNQNCWYCGKPADGPMLFMGLLMAHAQCVEEKLKQLLDPDYDGEDNDSS